MVKALLLYAVSFAPGTATMQDQGLAGSDLESYELSHQVVCSCLGQNVMPRAANLSRTTSAARLPSRASAFWYVAFAAVWNVVSGA